MIEINSVKDIIGIKTIFSDTFVNVISKISSVFFYFLFISLLLKYLGSTIYGKFNLFLMIGEFCSIVLFVWLLPALVRYGREELLQFSKINYTFTSFSIMFIAVLIIFTILFVYFYLFYRKIFFPFSKLIILFLFIFIILNIKKEFLNYVMQTIGEMKLIGISQFFQRLTTCFLLIFFIFYIRNVNLKLSILFLISGIIISILILLLKFPIKYIFPLKLNIKNLKKYINYSLPIFLASISAYFIKWIDFMYIKKFFNISVAGEFVYCQTIFIGFQQLFISVGTVIMPLIISLIIKKRMDLLKIIIEDITPIFSFFLMLFIIIFFIFAYFLFFYYFRINNFDIIIALFILLITLNLQFERIIYSCCLNGYEMMWIYFFTTFLTGILKIVLSYILIDQIGIIGGPVTTYLIVLLSFLIYSYFLKRKFIFEVKKVIILQCIFITSVIILGLMKEIKYSIIFLSIFIYIYTKRYNILRREKIIILNKIDLPIFLKKIFYLFVK